MAATARGFEEQQTLEGRSIVRTAETSTTAAAETAKAMVQSRFLVAINRPRNFEDCRVRILAACKRPRFAEMARYKKPTGGKFIEGMSIRFADEAAKVFGNIDTRQDVIYEDEEQRIVQVSVTDLETNLTKSGTVCVRKTVERREPKKGAEIVGERLNSTGQKVFIVKSTDDELLNKEANLCAKARRNLELQIVPQDLIEECEEEIIHTMRNADRADPDAAKKRIFDGFAAIGIMPRAIEEYLGHGTDTISPAEFQSLREIGAAIRDGQTTWAEVMEAKGGAKPKADRATVNLDDIKPGNAVCHKPVDAPLGGKPSPEDLSPEIIAKRDEAYSFLSAAYDEQGGKIDALLADHNQPPLPDISRDTTDEDQIAALIIAKNSLAPKKGKR